GLTDLVDVSLAGDHQSRGRTRCPGVLPRGRATASATWIGAGATGESVEQSITTQRGLDEALVEDQGTLHALPSDAGQRDLTNSKVRLVVGAPRLVRAARGSHEVTRLIVPEGHVLRSREENAPGHLHKRHTRLLERPPGQRGECAGV